MYICIYVIYAYGDCERWLNGRYILNNPTEITDEIETHKNERKKLKMAPEFEVQTTGNRRYLLLSFRTLGESKFGTMWEEIASIVNE